MSDKYFVQSTLDALTSCVAVLDEDGTILGVNHAWRAYGEARDADPEQCWVGANYLAVCDAAAGDEREVAQEVAAAIRDVAEQRRERFSLEYLAAYGGEFRWFVVRVTRYPTERPVRVVLAHEDITAFRKPALTPEERSDWMCHIADQLPLGAVYVDEDRVYFNEALAHITGYRPHELPTLDEWFQALFGEGHREVQELFELARQTGLEQGRELPIRHQDGSRRWVEFCGHHDDQGTLYLLRNVTEIKRLEEDLGEAREVRRRIQQAAPVAIARISDEGEIELCNGEAHRLLGPTVPDDDDDRLAQWLAYLVREDGTPWPAGEDPISRCLGSTESQVPVRLGLRRGDGQILWTSCTVVPVLDPPTKAQTGVVATFLDLTPLEEGSTAAAGFGDPPIALPGGNVPPLPTGGPVAPSRDAWILVCEPEELLRGVTCDVLRRDGYGVLRAASGEEANEVAAHHDTTIDLLITETTLEDMSGQELAADLTAGCPAMRTLYLVDTATSNNDPGARGPEQIEKPFPTNALLERVAWLLAQEPVTPR